MNLLGAVSVLLQRALAASQTHLLNLSSKPWSILLRTGRVPDQLITQCLPSPQTGQMGEYCLIVAQFSPYFFFYFLITLPQRDSKIQKMTVKRKMDFSQRIQLTSKRKNVLARYEDSLLFVLKLYMVWFLLKLILFLQCLPKLHYQWLPLL